MAAGAETAALLLDNIGVDHGIAEVANGVVQVVGCVLIRHKLYDYERDAKWHTALHALCDCLLENISVETARLLTLVSLLVKVNSEDDEAVVECLERTVALLRKVVLFPELVELRDRLYSILDEAKCQLVLQKCRSNSTKEEKLAVFKQYFGSLKRVNSAPGRELRQLLRIQEKKTGAAKLKKFAAEHSLSRFKEDLSELLSVAANRLPSFHAYNSLKDAVKFPLKDDAATDEISSSESSSGDDMEKEEEQLGPVKKEVSEREYVSDRAVSGATFIDDEAKVGEENEDKEDEEGEGVIDMEQREEEVSGHSSVAGESVADEMDCGKQQEDGSDSDSTFVPKKRRRLGEEITWDSDSSLVATPPSNLPERNKETTVLSKSHLLGHKRRGWTPSETEDLMKGVKKYGEGNWKVILDHGNFLPHRTAVSLKDKWRNLKGRRNDTPTLPVPK